ncbi:MAG: MFS transporter [Azospirillaceae bacterium]
MTAPPPPRDGQPPRAIAAWCLYDWANSAFNTVIGTFVFSVYFARGIHGDETAGSAAWGYAIGAAGFAVALAAPVMGAIADRVGRRKPWLAAFTAVTVLATAALWYARPDPAYVPYALALVVVASIAFELAGVVYNAMLPSVAPARMTGRVSGWGWGLGYIGGLACLAVALLGLVGLGETAPWLGLPDDAQQPVRATALLVAVWYALFALPIFLAVADGSGTGATARRAVREGLATLARTVRTLPRHGAVLRFLIASALYRDGLTTLFAVGGLYAAGTFGLSFEEILIFAIGLNVTAGAGAAGFAFVDDRIGSKPTVMLALAGLIGLGVPILLIDDATWFIALALALGVFVGPAQAASRSLMARLSPPDLATEFFGLYALTGKSIAFLGPLAFGLATDAFDSQRVGMATILVFLGAGAVLLAGVRAPGPAPR